MNQIYDPPNEYEAGLDFDYAAWSPNSTIRLCNVPWDSEYRNVVSFGTNADRNAWFAAIPAAQTRLYNNASYVKTDRPIKLDIPFNRALEFNYVRVSNPAQPINGSDITREFFYFILDVQYISPNCTAIIVQLDEWTTRINDVTLGNCFIERGHIGIANSKQFDNFGRDYLTVPEGLDIGSEYRIMKTNAEYVVPPENPFLGYDIIGISINNLEADPGTVKYPNRYTAEGSWFGGLPSGATYYLWASYADFAQFMRDFSEFPWVTQGIISLTVVPKLSRYMSIQYTKHPRYHGMKLENTGYRMQKTTKMAQNWRESTEVRAWVPERYRRLRKFFTSPYMTLELTTMTGAPISIKPEMWNSSDAEVSEMLHPVPPTQRLVAVPSGYNSNTRAEDEGFYNILGESIDFATQITAFPTLAIVNDMAISTLAGSAWGLKQQAQAAEWSMDRSLAGNQLSYDQAQAAIGLSGELNSISQGLDASMTGLGNRTAASQAVWGGVSNVISSAAGGAVGGPVGALAGAGMAAMGAAANGVNTAIQIGANDEALALRQGANRRTQDATTSNARYVADSNKSLADWASRGDYQQSINSMLAKKRDTMMVQPSTSGQVGGESFNFNFGFFGIFLRFKMLDAASMAAIGEYWLRWGYAVQRFARSIPSDYHVMQKFTYWKLSETNIISSKVPENSKRTIRGIFEKGVTVYRRPEDIGNIDIADNAPLGGITL